MLGNNFGNPLNGTNAHPYRFVFLDGCQTADGNLCKAFGIPKISNMNTNDFLLRGLRYRAFLGWSGYQIIAVGGINNQHVTFIGDFFEGWKTPKNDGSYRTLREAHHYAAFQKDTATAPLSFAKNLIIYGYEGLRWSDTLP